MQFATAKAGIILVSVFVESCNLVYPRISEWLVSHQVYCDFTGFREPGLSTARGRICTQKGKLMFIHAKKKSGMSLSIGLFKIYFYSNKFFVFYSWKPVFILLFLETRALYGSK